MSFTVSFKVKGDNYQADSFDCKTPPFFDQEFLCLETMQGEFIYVKRDLLEFFSYKEEEKNG